MTNRDFERPSRTTTDQLREQLLNIEKADAIYGCQRAVNLGVYRGWLYNLYETVIVRDLDGKRGIGSDTPSLQSAVECYFLTSTLTLFKVIVPVRPYFYISAPPENYCFIQERITFQYPDMSIEMVLVERNDLTVHNHILSKGVAHLRLTFQNLSDCRTVSSTLINLLRHKELSSNADVYRTASVSRILSTTDTRTIPHTLRALADHINCVLEHDINLTARFLIDSNVTLSTWYDVTVRHEPEPPLLTRLVGAEFELPPTPKVLAYDIETTKKPLRFPNAESGDQIMCISYMFDDQGYLLINRAIFGSNIADFEYTPKPEFPGKFACFNLPSERDVLVFFFNHIRMGRPNIFVTFNGDFFDWPFVEVRAVAHGMSLYDEIGVLKTESTSRAGLVEKQYYARAVPHLDCFRWVRRDSYLPQGSQGLKAVTRAKLKYHPDELSPELMVSYAQTNPQVLASYSVSDAVATYYLYKKYVHPFIFALGTIIPLNPDDILRRGTGTLCEHLLMVEAYHANVPFPNKHHDPLLQVALDANQEKRILISQTYVGGRVEAVNAGVYRHDMVYDFEYYSEAFKNRRAEGYGYLLRNLDRDLVIQMALSKLCDEDNPCYQKCVGLVNKIKIEQTSLESICSKEAREENGPATVHTHMTPGKSIAWIPPNWGHVRPERKALLLEHTAGMCNNIDNLVKYIEEHLCMNYAEVRNSIAQSLISCSKLTHARPLLYHLDVAAMYPNIMLTNKLQPIAIVDPQTTCASCDYSTVNEARVCQRMMEWDWRGSYYPLDYAEYLMIKNQTIAQVGPSKWAHTLSEASKAKLIHERLETFSRTQYKQRHRTEELRKKTVVCQRENSFFIDTVRKFRDRRYRYKKEQKDHTNKLEEAKRLLNNQVTNNLGDSSEAQSCRKEIETQAGLIVLKESLQLAHKCILNSFYGYAMRKGSRWYSLEMAAAVTHTGANIIKRARSLVEMVGFVLELDTDGIWCCLPASFPESYSFLADKPEVPGTVDGPYKRIKANFSYPGTMLNALTRIQNTNTQYLINSGSHSDEAPAAGRDSPGSIASKEANNTFAGLDSNDLTSLVHGPKGGLLSSADLNRRTSLSTVKKWRRINECSIEFEVDGPYSCMVLSAAQEEGVQIKKKYAVFDLAGKLSELKGFELKRRGELQIIKSFQARVFSQFLKGNNLDEAYAHAAEIANVYLDVIYERGSFLTDQQLITLISETSTLKNSLQSTAKNRKSAPITCAKRMASFLDPLFATVDGLCVEYIISRLPETVPVSERAIPVQIFNSPDAVKNKFLKQWTGLQKTEQTINIRDLLDWEYYLTRLSGVIYKIIVVPSGLQGSSTSPVKRIGFPDWLINAQKQSNSKKFSSILQQYLCTAGGASGNKKAKRSKKEVDTDDEDNPILAEDDSATGSATSDELESEGDDNDSSDSGNNAGTGNAIVPANSISLIPYPSSTADFPKWVAQQTIYWNMLIEKGLIGKPYYISHNTVFEKKGALFDQLRTTRLNSNPSKDFQLNIISASVLPSGKVSCVCVNQNNASKRIIFGTAMKLYFDMRNAVPQAAIDEYSSEMITLQDVTSTNLILPDMGRYTQLLLCKVSTDTYFAQNMSVQSLKSSIAVTDVYEENISGAFRFLIELPQKICLPETYDSRQFLTMGEVPYHYWHKCIESEELKPHKDPFSILPIKDSESPCHPIGFVVQTDEYVIAVLPDGELILVQVKEEEEKYGTDDDTSKTKYLLQLVELFMQTIEDTAKTVCRNDSKQGSSTLTLDTLFRCTSKYIMHIMNANREQLQKVAIGGSNSISNSNAIILTEAASQTEAIDVLARACSNTRSSAIFFWRTYQCGLGGCEKADISSFGCTYFSEEHFVINLPADTCTYAKLLAPIPSPAIPGDTNAASISAEPGVKRLPTLSGYNQALSNCIVTSVNGLTSLVVDIIVAQYISHLFTIPINLILDKAAYKLLLTPPLSSGDDKEADNITTMILDTLLAREYRNSKMLMPSRIGAPQYASKKGVFQRSGMYHGYSIIFTARNLMAQLLINYLSKPPVSGAELSDARTVATLPLRVTSSGRLRVLAKVVRSLVFSPTVAALVKQDFSNALERHIFTDLSLFFSSGCVEIINDELEQFYNAYNNVLAENGYCLVYADIKWNIISSEKFDPELLLNSYRYLLQTIQLTNIFQLYELPSMNTVYTCLCACPGHSQTTKEFLFRQLQNNISSDTDSFTMLSKTKSTPLSSLSSVSPLHNLKSPISAPAPSSPTLLVDGGIVSSSTEHSNSVHSATYITSISVLKHLAFVNINNYSGYACDLDRIIGRFDVQSPLPKELQHVFQATMAAYSLFMATNLAEGVKSIAAAGADLQITGFKFLEFLQGCAVGVITAPSHGNALNESELITLQTSPKTKAALRLLADIFHIYYIKNATSWSTELTDLQNRARLIRSFDNLSPGLYFVRTLMHFLSLDEQIKDAVWSFCWSILSGMGVHSPLDSRLQYGELLPKCQLGNILCHKCYQLSNFNVTSGTACTCQFCSQPIPSRSIKKALTAHFIEVIDGFFTQDFVAGSGLNRSEFVLQSSRDNVITSDTLLDQLHIFHMAGHMHNFPTLVQMCSFWYKKLQHSKK